MNRIVATLREWESGRRIDGVRLSPDDRALASALSAGEGRLTVNQDADGIRVDSSAWVGVVRFSEVEIRVVPKVVGENLGVLAMLEYSSGLSALARLESARTLAADRDGSLVDLLALLLSEAAIELGKRGVLSDYVTREQSLSRLRGRLLPVDQVRRHYGQVQVLECRFDELETDIVENQIVAGGLAIARRVATDPAARRAAARAHAIFSEVADPTAANGDTPPPEYSRRNEHYRPAHEVARMFLRNLAIHDLYSPGGADSFAFLLDMNRLFEDFVTRLLTDAFAGTDVRVRPQRRDRSLITDGWTGKPYASVIPDILLESGSPVRRVPVDAKYKLYDDRKVDQSDIYQTFFYAWAYADEDSPVDARAFILYPGRTDAAGEHLVAQTVWGSRGARIRAIPLDVPAAIQAVRDAGRLPLRELREAISA